MTTELLCTPAGENWRHGSLAVTGGTSAGDTETGIAPPTVLTIR
ncbi:MAG: hypothetical protein A07HN63_00109 [uncultured archaeon A07HN63]|nr:MAG: hypothetical protein A07HN63_00109 [uncultured archaeon A07HN63]